MVFIKCSDRTTEPSLPIFLSLPAFKPIGIGSYVLSSYTVPIEQKILSHSHSRSDPIRWNENKPRDVLFIVDYNGVHTEWIEHIRTNKSHFFPSFCSHKQTNKLQLTLKHTHARIMYVRRSLCIRRLRPEVRFHNGLTSFFIAAAILLATASMVCVYDRITRQLKWASHIFSTLGFAKWKMLVSVSTMCLCCWFQRLEKTSRIITLSDFHPFNSKYSDLFMCSTLGLPIQLTFSI